MAACYFGVWGGLVLFSVDDLRAGLGVILGVEVGVVRVFLGVRTMFCRESVKEGGCGDSGGDTRCGEDVVREQVIRSGEKGDGRVDKGNDDDVDDIRVVKERKTVPGS